MNNQRMKMPLAKIGSLLLLTLLTFSARALVVFQDPFNYANGVLTNVSANVWSESPGDALGTAVTVNNNAAILSGGPSVTSDYPRTYFTNGIASNSVPASYVINAQAPVYYFPSNSPVAALYYSYSLTAQTLPTATGSYFTFLINTNYTFFAKVLMTTTGAATGNYRLGVAGSASSTTNIVLQDLNVGSTYTVVVRYVLSTGITTLWVSPSAPASESDSSPSEVSTAGGAVTLTGGSATNTAACGFAFRNVSNIGQLAIGNLIIGTTFGDVVPSTVGNNPPFIVTQPLDNTSAIVGDNVTFTTLAGGDPVTYQWYENSLSNPLSGQTNPSLTLPAVTTASSGTYFCVASNGAGTATTRSAQLTVYASAVAPSISVQPASQTLNLGDTATFTVTAAGVPPPGYQWYYVTNSAGTLKTNAIAGATLASYSIYNISNNISGNSYYTIVTNRGGSVLTVKALLTVNPLQTVSIATLRSMVDPVNLDPTNTTSIYTAIGTVTSWTNMTGTANCEFYMQDGTGGLCVFWSGANSTNRPPAGALIKVTAPMSSYSGLFELEPVYTNKQTSVVVLSTNNPLPVAQALPFDPNVTFAQLKALEGCYCVASNVTLAAGSVFGSGNNEGVTNNNNLVLTDPIPGYSFTNSAGEAFDMYNNYYTDVPGKAKPSGPVTLYGVLGYYGDGTGKAGFEFTLTRYADVISYTHVTNYLSNIVRAGDALTNSFTEGALPPGETWTTVANIADAAGGIVTLTPSYTGLPASATWSNVTNGLNATAVFQFTPAPADAGSNYAVTLNIASSSGTTSTYIWNVYVPTPDEQQMAITEFLANPTTNTASPLFNPLYRSGDTVNIPVNDQYVEFANQSPNPYDLQGGNGWDIDNGSAVNPLLNFDDYGIDIIFDPGTAVVVYGGTGSGSPGNPLTVENSAPSLSGLNLPTTGTGVIILRNGAGYIVDRVVYNGSMLSTNSSLSRFPTINSPFAPQAYISTNVATAGLQYDGSVWSGTSKVPTGIYGVSISVTNKQAVLKFAATPPQVNTLWEANSLNGPFQVVNGGKFGSTAGTFSVTNLTAYQFFYITTQ
jgi:hypothetical protein